MQKWLLNLIIVGASFIGIQMISGELEHAFYFDEVISPNTETQTKMENEQELAEKPDETLAELARDPENSELESPELKEGETQDPKASEQSTSSAQEAVRTGVKNQPKNDTMVSTLNALDLSGLQTLKGVGPVTAQRILDYKASEGDFKSVEELLEVKGIGPKKLESIKDSLKTMQP